MHRRSLLSLFGLGTGAAASGVGPGALADSAGFSFPPRPNYPMARVMSEAGRGPEWTPADEATFVVRRRDALSWLESNGLPDYLRAKIRFDAEQQAAFAHTFPPEIEALRSFSAPAKRRLYVEMLVRVREREVLDGNRTDLVTQIARRTLPEAIRDTLGWF